MAVLKVSKQFNCSKQKLYKAWTEPEQLKQWWKPMGNQLTDVEDDLRPGGNIKYQFDKNALLIDGVYEKVENDLLQYTWNWHLKAEPINDAAYNLLVQLQVMKKHQAFLLSRMGLWTMNILSRISKAGMMHLNN